MHLSEVAHGMGQPGFCKGNGNGAIKFNESLIKELTRPCSHFLSFLIRVGGSAQSSSFFHNIENRLTISHDHDKTD